VKAFKFHLEQARRWRSAQLILQEARVSKAAAIAAKIQEQLESTTDALRESGVRIHKGGSGEMLGAYADFARQAGRRIRELLKHAEDAARALRVEMNLLIQARRRLQLLDDLKEGERDDWQRAFDKETADFVDESHLAKLNQLQSKKRAGA
jgi:hypothetical protein